MSGNSTKNSKPADAPAPNPGQEGAAAADPGAEQSASGEASVQPADRAPDQPSIDPEDLPTPGKKVVLSSRKAEDGKTIKVVTDGVRTWKEEA